MNPNRIGNREEAWLETSLKKSYVDSDGDTATALGTYPRLDMTEAKDVKIPETDRQFSSALAAFGISRKQLEAMGFGDREVQNRIYRTLTIWSSSMYDSLHNITNGNAELSRRLWMAYTRLTEICNPNTDVLNIDQRKSFETTLQKVHIQVEKAKMEAEERYNRMVNKNEKMRQDFDDKFASAAEELPRLRKQVAHDTETIKDLNEKLEWEKEVSANRQANYLATRDEKDELQEEHNKLKNEMKILKRRIEATELENERLVGHLQATDVDATVNKQLAADMTSTTERLKEKLSNAVKKKDAAEETLKVKEQEIKDRNNTIHDLRRSLSEQQRRRQKMVIALNQSTTTVQRCADALASSNLFVYDMLQHLQQDIDMSKPEYEHLHSKLEAMCDNVNTLSFRRKTDNDMVIRIDSNVEHTAKEEEVENRTFTNIATYLDKLQSSIFTIDEGLLEHYAHAMHQAGLKQKRELASTHAAINVLNAKVGSTSILVDIWSSIYTKQENQFNHADTIIRSLTKERDDGLEVIRDLKNQILVLEQKAEQLTVLSIQYDQLVTERNDMSAQRDKALFKYSKTHEIEIKVEELEDTLRREVKEKLHLKDVIAQHVTRVHDLSSRATQKTLAAEKANTLSVILLNAMTSLLDETLLQKHIVSTSLSALKEDKEIDFGRYIKETHSTIQAKYNSINRLDDTDLTNAEKTLILQVLQNVMDIKTTTSDVLHIANGTIALNAREEETDREMKSVKAWVQRERRRLEDNLEYEKTLAREDHAALMEDNKQLGIQISKLQSKVADITDSKQPLFDTIQKLEGILKTVPSEYLPPPEEEKAEEEAHEEEKEEEITVDFGFDMSDILGDTKPSAPEEPKASKGTSTSRLRENRIY